MAFYAAALVFLLVAGGICVLGWQRYARVARIAGRVREDRAEDEKEGSGAGTALLIRTVKLVGGQVPVSAAKASLVKRQLAAAGYRSPNLITVFNGARLLACAAGVGLGFLMRGQISKTGTVQMLAVATAGLAGYTLPGFILERLVSRRQERIRFALPDALDLLVVSVEAGMGLDQAIQAVSRELQFAHPALCDELALVGMEIQAGTTRSTALRNLASRTGEAEVKKLVAVLIQTDRFGTSLAESLRTHAEFLRTRRRQEAEERANKVGVKLVFPIFFCILPSMFLVTAGPAVLKIFKQLLPLMRELRG